MFCKHCGAQQQHDNLLYCTNCGQALKQPASSPVQVQPIPATPRPSSAAAPQYTAPEAPQYTAPSAPQYSAPATRIPPEYYPLGAWTYFWLTILFSIPFLGFIFLIIFSSNGSNLNRRSFARSFWIYRVISWIFTLIIIGTGGEILYQILRGF